MENENLSPLPYPGWRQRTVLPAVPEPPCRHAGTGPLPQGGAARAADIAVLPHRCLCAAGGGGHLRRGGLHHDRRQAYALEPAGADRRGGVLLLLRALLRQGRNAPKLLFQILIGTSLIVTFADYYAGWNGIAIDAIVPILCSVTLVLNFIFAFVNRRFTENGLVYLLLNIVVGVVPYIGLTLRHSVRPPMAWVICLIISMITFLGLVIFKGRSLLAEFEKNACTCKSEVIRSGKGGQVNDKKNSHCTLCN